MGEVEAAGEVLKCEEVLCVRAHAVAPEVEGAGAEFATGIADWDGVTRGGTPARAADPCGRRSVL